MLRTRVLSAIVLLPIVIACLVLGGWWFFGLVAIMLSVAVWEFVDLMRKGEHELWLPAALALVWIPLVDTVWTTEDLLVPGLSLVMVVGLIWSMTRFLQGESDPTANWALTVSGGLYLGVLGSHFLRLRGLENGLQWSVVAYGSTWFADSGAYFIGRRWGQHKMAPKLSPGKSWEGAVGGLIVGALSTAVLTALLGFGALYGLALGILIATVSPFGDLGVSMIKRQVGVKDTSRLIPGHGGFLDRIDSLLISVTLATYYVIWIAQ